MVTILVWGPDTEVENLPTEKFLKMNFLTLLSPLIFAVFYPNVGSILSWVGAVAGVIMIYFLPFFVYRKFIEAENLKYAI